MQKTNRDHGEIVRKIISLYVRVQLLYMNRIYLNMISFFQTNVINSFLWALFQNICPELQVSSVPEAVLLAYICTECSSSIQLTFVWSDPFSWRSQQGVHLIGACRRPPLTSTHSFSFELMCRAITWLTLEQHVRRIVVCWNRSVNATRWANLIIKAALHQWPHKEVIHKTLHIQYIQSLL